MRAMKTYFFLVAVALSGPALARGFSGGGGGHSFGGGGGGHSFGGGGGGHSFGGGGGAPHSFGGGGGMHFGGGASAAPHSFGGGHTFNGPHYSGPTHFGPSHPYTATPHTWNGGSMHSARPATPYAGGHGWNGGRVYGGGHAWSGGFHGYGSYGRAWNAVPGARWGRYGGHWGLSGPHWYGWGRGYWYGGHYWWPRWYGGVWGWAGYAPYWALLSTGSYGYAWYYCPSAGAYYPDVRECPENWQMVPADPDAYSNSAYTGSYGVEEQAQPQEDGYDGQQDEEQPGPPQENPPPPPTTSAPHAQQQATPAPSNKSTTITQLASEPTEPVYTWTDSDGATHYTNDKNVIPDDQKPAVRTVPQRHEAEPSAPAPAGAPDPRL